MKVSELKPHPRNYNDHPDDQVDHIIASIKQHGLYRNIVIAREGTVLAGHGVRLAVLKMGIEEVPVYRLDIDPNSPQALKVLAGDNEIAHLGMKDDRLLTEILKEIKQFDTAGLLGTGFDEKMLAALVYVTRPSNEIKDFDEAAEWLGMPDYDPEAAPLKIQISFRDEKDRQEFGRILGIKITDKTRNSWWPSKPKEDPSSIAFVQKEKSNAT